MKSYRKTFKNIYTDIGGKIILLIVGIILPKLYIENFGSEINGLVSSINNILVYINLLEAGVGGASTQALYKVIAENKTDDINGILSATDKFYKRTGLYFISIVSVLAFIYPYCVKSSISYGMICVLILLSAVPSALKYFFQGKYTVLLNADNRAYILNTVNLISNLLINISKVILLMLGANVIMVQSVYAVISLIQLLLIYLYIKRNYLYLDVKVKPNNLAISKHKYVMVHTISATIFSNIDVLVLTFFCDLKVVSVYSIYHLIYVHINQIIKGLANGTSASFGQLYATSKDRFKSDYKIFVVVYRLFAGVIMLALAMSTLPFIRIYAADFSDTQYVDMWLPILFFLTNYLDVIRWPEVIVVNCTGHFKETTKQAMLESVINLVLSLVLVHIWGLYGVLIATCVALTYRTIDFYQFVGRKILKETYLKDVIYMIVSSIISTVLIYQIQLNTTEFYNYVHLLRYALLAGGIGVILYVILAIVFYPQNCIMVVQVVKKYIKGLKVNG